MITSLYLEYFQKSKVFLFPALGISKRSYTQPTETYISWENMYTTEHKKLIAVYDNVDTDAFKAFELKVLLTNPMLSTRYRTSDGQGIYVFDMSVLDENWDTFMAGKYSQLNKTLKHAIADFYGTKSPEYQYIKSYLYPEEFYDIYASLLDIDVQILRKVGELCNPYDTEQEMLKILPVNLENLPVLV